MSWTRALTLEAAPGTPFSVDEDFMVTFGGTQSATIEVKTYRHTVNLLTREFTRVGSSPLRPEM